MFNNDSKNYLSQEYHKKKETFVNIIYTKTYI